MNALPSTRPYLIRAMHEWCSDHGFTPYIAVAVDLTVRVPMQHVANNEIVLNIATEATGGLVIGNDFIEFKARFGGVPQEIIVPVGRVVAIYARENGQGMAFPLEGQRAPGLEDAESVASALSTTLQTPVRGFLVVDGGKSHSDSLPDGIADPDPPVPDGPNKPKASLRRVK